MEWKVAWEGSVNQKTPTDGIVKQFVTDNSYIKTYTDFIVYAIPSPQQRCGNQIYLHSDGSQMFGSTFFVGSASYIVGWCVSLNPSTGNGAFGHASAGWASNGTTVTKILARK